MEISLPSELENAINDKISSGLYNNASEVVSEALRLSLVQERESSWLAREASLGFAQLEANQTITLTSKKEFFDLLRGAK